MTVGVGNKRARRRERLQMAAAVTGPLGKTFAHITDLSEIGLRIKLAKNIHVKTGETVGVYTREMGHLSGRVTWQRFKVLGVAIHTNTNTYAQTLSAVRSARIKQGDQF